MKQTFIALAILSVTFAAQASVQPAPPAAPAAVEAATVNVSGANTVAGAPLMLALNGAKAIEPTFQQLFDAGAANPKWKVVKLSAQENKSRMYLKSMSGKHALEMDVSSRLVFDLKVAKGSVIDMETQRSGQGALVKFSKDKTALGFMVNQSTTVVHKK